MFEIEISRRKISCTSAVKSLTCARAPGGIGYHRLHIRRWRVPHPTAAEHQCIPQYCTGLLQRWGCGTLRLLCYKKSMACPHNLHNRYFLLLYVYIIFGREQWILWSRSCSPRTGIRPRSWLTLVNMILWWLISKHGSLFSCSLSVYYIIFSLKKSYLLWNAFFCTLLLDVVVIFVLIFSYYSNTHYIFLAYNKCFILFWILYNVGE